MRGQTQQPSITQLLEIYDDTNPLNITVGNSGLKPSFNTNLRVNFLMMRRPKTVTTLDYQQMAILYTSDEFYTFATLALVDWFSQLLIQILD